METCVRSREEIKYGKLSCGALNKEWLLIRTSISSPDQNRGKLLFFFKLVLTYQATGANNISIDIFRGFFLMLVSLPRKLTPLKFTFCLTNVVKNIIKRNMNPLNEDYPCK
jgi:hypothetical protein